MADHGDVISRGVEGPDGKGINKGEEFELFDEADARLIAASPTMFDTLSDGGVSGDGGTTRHRFSDTLREVADQLDKAGCDAWSDWLRGKAIDIDFVLQQATGK